MLVAVPRLCAGKAKHNHHLGRLPWSCIPAGEVRNQIVNNLDLSATVMDWADATPGRTLDGRSFASVLANAQAAWRDAIFFSADSAIAATEI
jgi:arylsulfatase A-like enzyme